MSAVAAGRTASVIAATWLALAPRAFGVSGDATEDWRFVAAAAMNVPRDQHAAVALADGRVLVVGGSSRSVTSATRSAELYDPDADTWIEIGPMVLPRYAPGAARLPDGRVLVVGGSRAGFTAPTAHAEIFDPATGAFREIGPMSVPRGEEPSVVITEDGRVLVVSGTEEAEFATGSRVVDELIIERGEFRRVGELVLSRRAAHVVPLPERGVLVVGGTFRCCSHPADASRRWTSEVFDVGRGAYLLDELLPSDGIVWVGQTGGRILVITRRAVHSRPVADDGQWSLLSRHARRDDTLSEAVLTDGRLLAWLPDATLFDPATGERRSLGIPAPRKDFTATLLPSGCVILAGGARPPAEGRSGPTRDVSLLCPERAMNAPRTSKP